MDFSRKATQPDPEVVHGHLCAAPNFCNLPLGLETSVTALTKGSSREDGDVDGTWRMARSKLLHRPHIKVCQMCARQPARQAAYQRWPTHSATTTAAMS